MLDRLLPCGALACALTFVACAPPAVDLPAKTTKRDAAPTGNVDEPEEKDASGGYDFALVDLAGGEVTAPLGKTVVYAHSGSDLFRVDPEMLAIERVGNLILRAPDGKMSYLNDVTDIAVDRQGKILGLRYRRGAMFAGAPPTVSELLAIDPETAECTRVAMLPPEHAFNGLSWIKTDDGGGEYLAATTYQGRLFRIDPSNGAATLIGEFGPGLGSSGDVVSVTSYGTLATLTGKPSDLLARIDPVSGKATVIGTINGFKEVYGLGFWGSRVFGFTRSGQLILIDPKTAAAKEITRSSAFPYNGAGVTTSVPVIVE